VLGWPCRLPGRVGSQGLPVLPWPWYLVEGERWVDGFLVDRQGLAAGVVRLELAGEVDMMVSAELTSAQLREIRDPVVAGLVVDLNQVTFLDSTGIAALVTGMRAARERGIPFTVTNPHRMVRTVLEVTGLLGPLTGSDLTASDSTVVEETSGGAGR